ncbi:MAG TPA: ABC transporter permease [Solirubrobacteraceae bacterium]|nr:ABC transporter permease [Solirubrobacteraceae bacterium]
MALEGADIVAPHKRLIRAGLASWATLVYIFLFAPIVLLVLFSFNANKYGTLPITGWTTHWYTDAFNNEQIKEAVEETLKIALEVTAIATLVGTCAAFPLVRSHIPFRSGLRVALILPILIPGLLIGVSLLTFFTSVLHVMLSSQTAVIGQSVYVTPFVILVVASRLEGFDRSLERAAADLGASSWQVLRRIVLPLLAPAIIAGALFAFTLSLDEFVITLFLIGGGNTLPIYIYTQVKFGITPEVNAVATILIASSLTLGALGLALPVLIRRVRNTSAFRRRPRTAIAPATARR